MRTLEYGTFCFRSFGLFERDIVSIREEIDGCHWEDINTEIRKGDSLFGDIGDPKLLRLCCLEERSSHKRMRDNDKPAFRYDGSAVYLDNHLQPRAASEPDRYDCLDLNLV